MPKPLKIHIKAENLTAVVYGEYKATINGKCFNELSDQEKMVVNRFISEWKQFFKQK